MYFEPVRYRLTAEVETPEGTKTGSSVIQTIWDRGLSEATVKGEAVAVDLPNGERLFVLLQTANDPNWAGGIPGIHAPRNKGPLSTADERKADAARSLAWIRANRDVHYLWGQDVPEDRAQYLPYMVRFRDVHDPSSVELVKPDNLSVTFGPGYRLKSLTVQITEAPVTEEISRRLAWLDDYTRRKARLNRSTSIAISTNGLSDSLGTGAFRTGF